MKSLFQRSVVAILIAAMLLGTIPQYQVSAAPVNQTSTGCAVLVLTGPAAGVLVPTCIITWEGLFWVVTLTAVVGGVAYTRELEIQPSSSKTVRIAAHDIKVTVPAAPQPVPAPAAVTPVPAARPAQTGAPTAPQSYNFTVEQRADGTWWCRGGPSPSAYTQGGWHYSDCSRLGGMPWPGGSAAPAATPAPVAAPAPPQTGFGQYAESEAQLRARLAEEAAAAERVRAEEERRNRRCPPLPGVSQAYNDHIAQGHSVADWQAAITALNGGVNTYYQYYGGEAWGAYRSKSPIPGSTQHGWQVWKWSGGQWIMLSTYPRANIGTPFQLPSNVPPPAGCRPVTLR